MNKMILALALTLSSTVYAQMCEVELVENRTRRVLSVHRSHDEYEGCKEGMKACRFEIRQRGLLNRADCVRRDIIVDGNPYPYPQPQPLPQPQRPYPDTNRPYPGSYDARRMISQGETVIHNNRFVSVVGVSFAGTFTVRTTDIFQTMMRDIRREDLSVMNGCNQDLCTSDSVIDVTFGRYVKVIGLSFNDTFVTQTTDIFNTIQSNVERRSLARTSGCVSSRYAQICVNDVVIDTFNRYSTVIAVQLDGRVVIRTNDIFNTIQTNIEPSVLVVTR